jgi:hypothetical protein
MVIILMNVMRITTVSMCVCIDDFQLVFADTRLEFSESNSEIRNGERLSVKL